MLLVGKHFGIRRMIHHEKHKNAAGASRGNTHRGVYDYSFAFFILGC